MIATARAGETVDEICWRVLGLTDAVTEQTFELNPGLADLGETLPAGTQVTLPEITKTAAPQRAVIQLWD